MGTVTKDDLAGKAQDQENKQVSARVNKALEFSQPSWTVLTVLVLAGLTQLIGLDAPHLVALFLIINGKSLLNITVKQALAKKS